MTEFDFSQAIPSSEQPDPVAHEHAGHHLRLFAAEVHATVDALRPRGGFNAENQVQVQPGGKIFSTISDAIASITDASQKKQYVCYIGPGTYEEKVVCKSWVFLAGSGSDQTFVTSAATKDGPSKGTVKGAANSAIQDMAVSSTGTGSKSYATAVACDSVKNFDIENCSLLSVDPAGGAFAVPLAVDFASAGSSSLVYVAYSQLTVTGALPDTQALGLIANNSAFVQLTNCRVIAADQPDAWGAAANYLAKLTIDTSYVEGKAYSLKIVDLNADLIANQCELVGAVGSGVVVNP